MVNDLIYLSNIELSEKEIKHAKKVSNGSNSVDFSSGVNVSSNEKIDLNINENTGISLNKESNKVDVKSTNFTINSTSSKINGNVTINDNFKVTKNSGSNISTEVTGTIKIKDKSDNPDLVIDSENKIVKSDISESKQAKSNKIIIGNNVEIEFKDGSLLFTKINS